MSKMYGEGCRVRRGEGECCGAPDDICIQNTWWKRIPETSTLTTDEGAIDTLKAFEEWGGMWYEEDWPTLAFRKTVLKIAAMAAAHYKRRLENAEPCGCCHECLGVLIRPEPDE